MSLIKLSARKRDYKREIIAGCTTFLAMMYIIVVNPTILAQAGMPFQAVLTATVLVTTISCILMGLFADNPIAIAPTMGVNAFFTYTVVLQMHISWRIALGAVFWSGILFIILSFLNVRSWILKAIPKQLRYALAAGIGLFIAVIGLRNAGFIVSNIDTLTAVGHLHADTIIFLMGLLLTSILVAKRIKGALIIGIFFTTLLAIPLGRWYGGHTPMIHWHGVFAKPDFSLFMQMDLVHSLKFSLIPVLFTFLFTILFDGLSTFIGVAEAGNLLDMQGQPRNLKPSLLVDAFSGALAGILGSSSGGAYIESAAGIEEGGRTGLTTIVVGLLFIPFMFLAPLAEAVPIFATAPVLVIVGVFMSKVFAKIHWQNFDDALPSFIVIMVIPMANSITAGIIWGFLSWSFIKILVNKVREVSLTLWIVNIFAVVLLITENGLWKL